MTSPEDYVPQPSSWFSSSVIYSGIGRVDFSSPQGWVEGDMVCEVNNLGSISVTLEIHKSENCEAPSNLSSTDSRDWLLAGFQMTQQNSRMRIYPPHLPTYNSISSIRLTTSDGHVLTSDRVSHYSWTPIGAISLQVVLATYIVQPKTEAKYWVLPCINLNLDGTFGAVFSVNYQDLREHPLRIFPVSQDTLNFLNSDAPAQERSWVNNQVIALSKIVAFEYKNGTAFIERLPDADRLITDLKSGQTRSAVTSLMIGPYSSEAEELDPLDLTPVLGLATGRPMGAAWVEFRDYAGNLVYRIHGDFGRYTYGRGRTVIHELINTGGVGTLLADASKSKAISDPLFRGTLISCAKAMSGEDGTEMLYFMFTAIETLCSHYKIKDKIHPIQKYLTPTQIGAIQSVLNQAAQKIKAMTSGLSLNGKGSVQEQKDAILKVFSKTKTEPLEKRTHFADKLFALMEELKLEDAQILIQHYGTIEPWLNKVNIYRNRTMHWTHYEDVHSQQARQDFEQMIPHLTDILIRCLLKTIGYTGHYGPCVWAAGGDEEIDWVKPALTPRSLGYR